MNTIDNNSIVNISFLNTNQCKDGDAVIEKELERINESIGWRDSYHETLIKTFIRPPKPGLKERVRKFMIPGDKKPVIFIMGRSDGLCRGYAVARPDYYKKNACYLSYLAVERAFQGKGLGSLLLKKIAEKAKSAGFEQLIIDCAEKALRFYQKSGLDFSKRNIGTFVNSEENKFRLTLILKEMTRCNLNQ